LAVYALKLDCIDATAHKLVTMQYKKNSKPNVCVLLCVIALSHFIGQSQVLKELTAQTELSEREINQQLWMLRRSTIQKKKMIKFTEAGYGLILLVTFLNGL
jgi:hypothetical protein